MKRVREGCEGQRAGGLRSVAEGARSTLSRRGFLAGCAATSLGAISQAGAQSGRSQRNRRPNILVFITDDQSWPHASAYQTGLVSTPTFDRIASAGVLFTNAWVSVPSCAPSRASLLTGQEFYRLGSGSMNFGYWDGRVVSVVDYLDRAGYASGYTGKGWIPGSYRASGRKVSPAGRAYHKHTIDGQQGYRGMDFAANFKEFLTDNQGKPFLFWVGSIQPHRPYQPGVGVARGKKITSDQIPSFLPDEPSIRADLADYASEIETADTQFGKVVDVLASKDMLENTLIMITSDNGMPFPGAKATLYGWGTHVPLAISWPMAFSGARVVDDFVRLPDLGATIMDAAGLAVSADMTGRSLLPLLTSKKSGLIETSRDMTVLGIEKHTPYARRDDVGYPSRAIRTSQWLYIRNYLPDAYPSGDPVGDPYWISEGFGEADPGPAKEFLLQNKSRFEQWYKAAFAKRPSEELYKVVNSLEQRLNLAADESYTRVKADLSARMDEFLRRTADPRATGQGTIFDQVKRPRKIPEAADHGLP